MKHSWVAVQAVTAETARTLYRSPVLWVLLGFCLVSFHYAFVFNISAFAGSAALTREMIQSAFWIQSYILTVGLTLRSLSSDENQILRLFPDHGHLVVLGKMMGILCATLGALLGQVVLFNCLGLVWEGDQFDPEWSHQGLLLLASALAVPLIAAWTLFLELHLPRIFSLVGLILVFVLGHGHEAIFLGSPALEGIGVLLPRFQDYRDLIPARIEGEAPDLAWRSLLVVVSTLLQTAVLLALSTILMPLRRLHKSS